jgi:hypothetical protein
MQTRTTAFILALLAFPAGALATPLDQPTCDTLKIERDTLVAAGLETEMARGPEWAKTNLPPDRLKQIARMIEVDEQLSFRCGELATARPTLKEPKPVEAAAVPGKKEAATAPAGQSATASTGDEAPVKKKKKTASQKKAKSKDAAASPPTAGAGSALSP